MLHEVLHGALQGALWSYPLALGERKRRGGIGGFRLCQKRMSPGACKMVQHLKVDLIFVIQVK